MMLEIAVKISHLCTKAPGSQDYAVLMCWC